MPFLKYQLIFLRVLTVFGKPVGESNGKKKNKISASISKENIFVVKLKNFAPGLRVQRVEI